VIELKGSDLGGEVRVSVRDQGLGIPAEAQGGLFQKFARVRGESNKGIEGTGMGLYLVKEIIEAHGGRVGLESEAGKGSTFWFTLPRKQAE
jgi:signal transduction histidine kinase